MYLYIDIVLPGIQYALSLSIIYIILSYICNNYFLPPLFVFFYFRIIVHYYQIFKPNLILLSTFIMFIETNSLVAAQYAIPLHRHIAPLAPAYRQNPML